MRSMSIGSRPKWPSLACCGTHAIRPKQPSSIGQSSDCKGVVTGRLPRNPIERRLSVSASGRSRPQPAISDKPVVRLLATRKQCLVELVETVIFWNRRRGKKSRFPHSHPIDHADRQEILRIPTLTQIKLLIFRRSWKWP